MAIQIGNYNFEGPFGTLDALRNASGVYAILGSNSPQEYVVLDIGESATLKDRIAGHDRQGQWRACGYETLLAAAHYTYADARMRIERELRAIYSPPCGLR
jgi:hypothetical protein